jgi:N-dimethylarginine dimethylaminohydrolase
MDAFTTPTLSEVGQLVTVVMKHAREAFVDEATIAAQWQRLNFTAPPNRAAAIDEYERFVEVLRSVGAAIQFLPADAETTLDSIYARDASIVSPKGVILCRMGKPARRTEPDAQARAFAALGSSFGVLGRIEPPGLLEGGDVVWLDSRTLVVGCGYRTNAEGIRQLKALVGDAVDVVEVPLPHWRGENDVMHLMSLLSPVDRDLAVVYSPLLPVPFRQLLLERGIGLVEVCDEEFGSMGCNVLALAPRRCVMLAGNPRTRAALERAGVEVIEYAGNEISVKGAGGPTCLTRPIVRRRASSAVHDNHSRRE